MFCVEGKRMHQVPSPLDMEHEEHLAKRSSGKVQATMTLYLDRTICLETLLP